MHRTIRSLVTLVITVSILLAVPLAAGAREPQASQPTLRAAESWVDAALGWLQDALAVRRPARRHHSPAGLQSKDATGGSCVDPQGNPKPWCL